MLMLDAVSSGATFISDSRHNSVAFYVDTSDYVHARSGLSENASNNLTRHVKYFPLVFCEISVMLCLFDF